MPHQHGGHACHDENCDHDHSSDITPVIQNHLYSQIDFSKVRTLNESVTGSGRKILEKTWDQRLDQDPTLESDADEQLITHVPFTGQVRLHTILLRTENTSSAPRTLHVLVDNEDADFNTITDMKPTQSFDIAQTSDLQEINVKRQLFSTAHHLCLFFEENWGEDTTRLGYIGFKGDFMKLSREPVDVLYEAAARPSDHKVKGTSTDLRGMGLGR